MLYFCVRDVMDLVFSVCIDACSCRCSYMGSLECFVMQML